MEETGKGVKRRYCECTGTRQPPTVFYNSNGVVAANGEIPDHLKIEGAVTVRIPIPSFKKLPADPADPLERLKVFTEKFIDGLGQATKKPRMVCSSCKQEEEGDFIMVQANRTHLPSHSGLIDQSMEESEEGGYFGWTIEYDYDDGCTYLVRNRADADFSEYMYYKGVVINKPGIVAAVGGIPHELKINGGISFSMPCPVFKHPKVMPEDPTEYQKIIDQSYKETMESDAFINAFIQAYIKAKSEACGVSSSSICHKEEEAHNVDQHPITMLEFNIAATPGWYHYLRSVSSDPMERSDGVKSVRISEISWRGFTTLQREIGDFIEFVPLMGVLFNKPGFVAAVGGIPNELKIEAAGSSSDELNKDIENLKDELTHLCL